TAMLVRARTTRGAVRPGVFHKETPVKLVFADERSGEMLDVFVVPEAELSPEQLARSPLMESELQWDQVEEVSFPEPSAESAAEFSEILRDFRRLAERIGTSPRAIHDLAGWDRLVELRTEGGTLHLQVRDGRLSVL